MIWPHVPSTVCFLTPEVLWPAVSAPEAMSTLPATVTTNLSYTLNQNKLFFLELLWSTIFVTVKRHHQWTNHISSFPRYSYRTLLGTYKKLQLIFSCLISTKSMRGKVCILCTIMSLTGENIEVTEEARYFRRN